MALHIQHPDSHVQAGRFHFTLFLGGWGSFKPKPFSVPSGTSGLDERKIGAGFEVMVARSVINYVPFGRLGLFLRLVSGWVGVGGMVSGLCVEVCRETLMIQSILIPQIKRPL